MTDIEQEDSIELVEVLLQDFFDLSEHVSERTLDLAERNIFVQAFEQVLFCVLLELRLKHTWLIKLFSCVLIIHLNSLVLPADKRLQRICARTKRIVIVVGLILISSDDFA